MENPDLRFTITRVDGVKVFRNVTPIYNEKPCRKCHEGGPKVMSVLAVELSMDKLHQSISEARNGAAVSYGVLLLLETIGSAEE